jgi:hypothetical protein
MSTKSLWQRLSRITQKENAIEWVIKRRMIQLKGGDTSELGLMPIFNQGEPSPLVEERIRKRRVKLVFAEASE